MADDIRDELREAFADPEYRQAYVDSFLNTSIAAQLKALREDRGWSQAELGRRAGMRQESISRLENVNYSSWSVSTLRRLAAAFDLALVVRFESFGTRLDDIAALNREALLRPSFGDDPKMSGDTVITSETPNNVVTMSGFVARQRAMPAAERARGVTQVVDPIEMEVKWGQG